MTKTEVLYNNEWVNPYQVLDLLGINVRYLYAFCKGDSTLQEAFNNVIAFAKNEPFLLQSNSPARKEITKRSSIIDFCMKHKIRYNTFCKLLKRKKNLSFIDLIESYLEICEEFINYNYKNIYCGISIEAICIKYQINYSDFSKCYDCSKPLKEQLLLFVFNKMNLSDEMKEQIIPKISLLWNAQLVEVAALFKDKRVCDKAMEYYKRIYDLQDALNAYYIIYYFEQDWIESYYNNLPRLKELYPDISDLKNLKTVYRQALLNHYGYSEEELLKMKSFFYSDFVFVNNVHIYKRSKMI